MFIKRSEYNELHDNVTLATGIADVLKADVINLKEKINALEVENARLKKELSNEKHKAVTKKPANKKAKKNTEKK